MLNSVGAVKLACTLKRYAYIKTVLHNCPIQLYDLFVTTSRFTPFDKKDTLPMLSQQDQLTELVRQLEDDNHVFAADPLLITEKLQAQPGTDLEKLHWRAQRIDSNGKLAETLTTIDTRIQAIIWLLSALWCLTGFLGLFTLLQSQVVNFFYVLASLLGFHTLMLLLWLLLTARGLFNKQRPANRWFAALVSPNHLIRGKDDVTQAAVRLYEQQLSHAGMRWYLGKISHRLWLATLTGMLLALLALFLVKNYQFTWESTLLSAESVAALVRLMAWLPDLVGFATPDIDSVLAANPNNPATASAYDWAMLLIGSLLLYGIVPRAIAWGLCVLMFNREQMQLDLSLPYYQKILNFWQRQVVDADDFIERPAAVAPVAEVSQGKKLVALLEYPYPDEHWYQFQAGHNIEYFGILDDRDDMDRLLGYLADNRVQVLLGIHSHALPDRGTLRKLGKIAQAADEGLIVQLLPPQLPTQPDAAGMSDNNEDQNATEQQRQRQQQWHEALNKYQIGLLSAEGI